MGHNNGFRLLLAVISTIFTGLITGCATTDESPMQEVSDVPVERLFLQQVTATSAIVKWRGGGDQVCWTDGRRYRKAQSCKDAVIENHANGTSHKYAKLEGLEPEQRYYYNVNGIGSREQRFKTAPVTGTLPKDGNTRLWVIGDSGTATAIVPKAFGGTGEPVYTDEADRVRDGYLNFVRTHGKEEADLFLLLGDNAYNEGSDIQWQGAFFEMYPDIMNKTAVWPTIGNHEMGAAFLDYKGGITAGGVSVSADPQTYADLDDTTVDNGLPYLDIFTLPANGETGGVPSKTEQYYSFDYANVHVISLDSQVTARDPVLRETMKQWLIMDLSANMQDWTIVIFHHPLYTKGSHDSDEEPSSRFGIDLPIIDIRREFTPVFEDHGVDLVYGGHSHSYERSWYLNGHRGDASTFDASLHTELNDEGEPASGQGKETYGQIARSGSDDKVVYTVAGSSGHVNTGSGKLDHPAHFEFPDGKHGLALMGSVVIDASEDELTATFVDEYGLARDHVTITR
jgi:hypothetical protein